MRSLINGNHTKKNPRRQISTLIAECTMNRVRSQHTSFLGHINFMHRTRCAMTMQKIAVAKGVAIMIADSYRNPAVWSTILNVAGNASRRQFLRDLVVAAAVFVVAAGALAAATAFLVELVFS